MRRIGLILGGLLLTSSAVAGKAEHILGSEETITQESYASPIVSPISKTPVGEELPVVHLNTAQKDRALTFSLRGGWSQRNYRLTSSGVNANLPGAAGYELEGIFEKEINESQKLSVSFQWGTHRFADFTDFTPASFRISSMQAIIQYGFLAFGTMAPGASSWWLWAGYEAKKRSGQAGLPVSPITDVFFHGLRVGVSYEGARETGGFGIDASTFLMLPIFFREDVETTGSYRFGLTTESSLMVHYGLRDTLSIAVGGRFYLDYRTYFGTGTRSTVNATELEPVISVPVEIRLRF